MSEQEQATKPPSLIALGILLIILGLAISGGVGYALYELTEYGTLIVLGVSLGSMGLLSLLFLPILNSKARKPFNKVVHELYELAEPADNRPNVADSETPEAMMNKIGEMLETSIEEADSIDGERQLLDNLLDRLSAGVITLGPDQKITKINQTALTTLGRHSQDLIGSVFSNQLQFKISEKDQVAAWIKNASANKIKDDHHWPYVDYSTAERQNRTFEIFGHYSKGDESGHDFIITIIDHTEQQNSEDQKVDFIAIAAHELRAPITVIRGYIQVFEDEISSRLKPDEVEFLRKMQVSAAQLAGFINNILSVARIEREHIPVNLVEDNWRDVVIEACTDLHVRAEAHRRHLKLVIPKQLPSVAVDRASIVHVINNIVDNAIKYTRDDDTIIVRVGVNAEDMIQTSIEDHGIGIPSSLMGSLFTKFYRSHRSKNQFGGTGLGLYLSKTIVESHYGSLWAKSKEGQGSVFSFALPKYEDVKEKIAEDNNDKLEGITRKQHGWIKNHSLYRR